MMVVHREPAVHLKRTRILARCKKGESAGAPVSGHGRSLLVNRVVFGITFCSFHRTFSLVSLRDLRSPYGFLSGGAAHHHAISPE